MLSVMSYATSLVVHQLVDMFFCHSFFGCITAMRNEFGDVHCMCIINYFPQFVESVLLGMVIGVVLCHVLLGLVPIVQTFVVGLHVGYVVVWSVRGG